MIKSFCERFVQYKHARRYMEFLETTLFNADNYYEQYKRFHRARQENDYLIKKSFVTKPDTKNKVD